MRAGGIVEGVRTEEELVVFEGAGEKASLNPDGVSEEDVVEAAGESVLRKPGGVSEEEELDGAGEAVLRRPDGVEEEVDGVGEFVWPVAIGLLGSESDRGSKDSLFSLVQ